MLLHHKAVEWSGYITIFCGSQISCVKFCIQQVWFINAYDLKINSHFKGKVHKPGRSKISITSLRSGRGPALRDWTRWRATQIEPSRNIADFVSSRVEYPHQGCFSPFYYIVS